MEKYITIGLFIAVFGVICYWAIKILCDNKATSYFNANIKDSLQNLFNGYKNEILNHLKDIKNFKDFRESKILIINDSKNFIENNTFFTKFTNKQSIHNVEEKLDDEYSMVIIYAEENTKVILENWKTVIAKISNITPIIIYTGTSRIEQEQEATILLNKIYTPVNNQFTLIDRLLTSYMIKKVIEDKND